MFADLKWSLESIVCVPSDEVLKQKLGVCEVGSVVLERLSVASNKSLLEVGRPPDELLHVLGLEHVLSLTDELISSHLDVLIKEVASKYLLSVLSVHKLGVHESVTHDGLGDKLEVLVVEEHVVVIEEQEGHN